MKLSAHPFHPHTGKLLPAYRDAYLRGDVSNKSTEAIDAYLRNNGRDADETLRRFHTLEQAGHAVKPIGWVRRQFDLVRTEPQRFRHRAAMLVAGAAVLGTAVFAGTNLPVATRENTIVAVDNEVLAPVEANGVRMITVKGRILNENGQPLVGATVLQKGSYRGVSTDATGHYALRVAAGQQVTLQYGYGGYVADELHVVNDAVANVTLLPQHQQPLKSKKRWLLF